MKNLLSILFLFSFAHLIFGQNQDRNTFSSNTLYVGKSITAPEAYDTNKENYYDEISPKIFSLYIEQVNFPKITAKITGRGNQFSVEGIIDNDNITCLFNGKSDNGLDGMYELKIENDSIKGYWLANNQNSTEPVKKNIVLGKRTFLYNPQNMISEEFTGEIIDFEHPKNFKEKNSSQVIKYRVGTYIIYKINASTDVLTSEILKNMRKLDLEIIKNSILARHGFSFKDKTFMLYFSAESWYIPNSINVDADLTDIEKSNIVLLNQYIATANDVYKEM